MKQTRTVYLHKLYLYTSVCFHLLAPGNCAFWIEASYYTCTPDASIYSSKNTIDFVYWSRETCIRQDHMALKSTDFKCVCVCVCVFAVHACLRVTLHIGVVCMVVAGYIQ